MKKFSYLATVFAAFFALACAGCSNSAGGGNESPSLRRTYEETLTIDLSSASDKLSAAGVASLSAGTDVSEWFSDNTVSRSVGSSGFIGFKAVIVSATETSLVIKVTGVSEAKKCSVTLSITIPATVTASGQEVKKENVKTVVIDTEPEILQTEHVKVEKVSGGIKFTITRPSESCYNPNAVLGEVKDENGNPTYIYKYVGQGKGNFEEKYEYVGDGKGSYSRESYARFYYYYVGAGNGNFEEKYEYVGDGNGYYKKLENGEYYYVQDNGDYIRTYKDVGNDNGSFLREEKNYIYVGDGNGDYAAPTYEDVGDGNGSYKKELNKIYGGWNWSYIESSDGMWADFYPCDKDSIECIYPLCEPGKRYDFTVNFQPKNVNLKEFHKFEKLSVIAENGIGEFTSLKKDGCLDMSYDGTKLILKLKNYKAPENVKNLRTVVEYFATNQSELIDGHVDWNTSYAVVCLATKSFEGAVYECEVDSFDSEGGIETALATREKDTLYAQCFFTFDVPEATGFGITGHGGFRTPGISAVKKIR
ncbi:MAG: hypothetical protein VZQ47_07135 [Treponema sp.]|nr:hypothetical protein [Treponema sp.]MEE3435314.1 hypothetical protein [Treponema sp.]